MALFGFSSKHTHISSFCRSGSEAQCVWMWLQSVAKFISNYFIICSLFLAPNIPLFVVGLHFIHGDFYNSYLLSGDLHRVVSLLCWLPVRTL